MDGDITAISSADAMGIVESTRTTGAIPGYDLTESEPKTIFDVMTREGPCVVVIVDPDEAEVAVHGMFEPFGEPTLATFFGASIGGDTRIGWILEGAQLNFEMANGDIVLTPIVLSVLKPREDDDEEADRVIAEARRRLS